MYLLKDTFNDRVISRHRTLEAAAKAWAKHDRDVERNNGSGTYIPKKVTFCDRAGNESELDDRRREELDELLNESL